MNNLKIVAGILLVALLASCGENYKKQAAAKLKLATSYCEKGDSSAAVQLLDSIPVLFPEAAKVVTQAKELNRKINAEILFRKQEQLDKISARITELEKSFTPEKTDYDQYTRYVPKMQNAERRWDQSYLQVHLDERGTLYISSNYYGKEWLDHVAVRVYDGVFQAKTDTIPLGDINNYHGEFMDTHWEKVSYKNGTDNGVIQFIADNVDRNLKAVFLGTRMYYVVLEKFDKQAVKDALSLSVALKQRAALDQEIRRLRQNVK
jgi:hypothetical protein